MSIPPFRFNEQLATVSSAQTTGMFEEDVGFALGHFAEDDDVFGVLGRMLVYYLVGDYRVGGWGLTTSNS